MKPHEFNFEAYKRISRIEIVIYSIFLLLTVISYYYASLSDRLIHYFYSGVFLGVMFGIVIIWFTVSFYIKKIKTGEK